MSTVERFGHGGDVWTAADAFGVDSKALLDFSANINPLGPPTAVMERLRNEMMASIVHYPDPGHRKMKKALAAKLGVGEDYISIGNGAAECMALLLLAIRPQRVGVIAPCFSEYETLSRKFGSEVIHVVGSEDNDFCATEAQLSELISKTDVVFIGHPNNPNGALYERALLERLAVLAEAASTILVIDEAFIDFANEEEMSLVPIVYRCPNLIVVRSLTKFYAIPGLRLGYAIAQPQHIEAMLRMQVAWSVNGLALAAGEALLSDEQAEPYANATRALIAEERAVLRKQLHALGIRTWPSVANFLLCRAPEGWTAKLLQAELCRAGILIRNCDMYAGLTERDFRIAVKDRRANGIVASALAAVLQ
ncbi:threonine-phosphate decarboxylase CobD [Paenibacillus alvei]|uniref:threonine-phosphate decarboxylase n=1 Tax=Paenibacillus alvei TaxID=44250 RepID=A0AAP7A1V7_PAEAL|nr:MULTISPECIES: threonine-phosphate decarboxylase CobD [Paenibacillus]EJW16834.1 aminotransferase class I and II [Paenibacillus alvei DSM 29]MCY9540817.1 threonine-phosphate decarboxylase CobD [Paenibacillus alvei]MCY9705162.1 threonine-phosphate decarboxylase CobD [Paenibacillus alvei]MCY9733791.1 threonine-phosphate decarboxylase CobD [Paenibacillus alvei]MCY9756185.1 threonine-phosphate decarboxylase CobD [Paenibacillus alvei]